MNVTVVVFATAAVFATVAVNATYVVNITLVVIAIAFFNYADPAASNAVSNATDADAIGFVKDKMHWACKKCKPIFNFSTIILKVL